MSILDLASGQNVLGDQGHGAVSAEGWPNAMSGEGNSTSGSLLYDAPKSPMWEAVEQAQVEEPTVMAQEMAPQATPGPHVNDALMWHNQGLMQHIQQLEARQAQLKPLEDLFKYDPTAYNRVLDAIMQPYSQPQQAVQAQQDAPPPQQEKPLFPWEQPPAAQQPQPQQNYLTPQQAMQMQAAMLAETVSPLKQEVHKANVKLAEYELREQIGKMQATYGENFNPREVVAYALAKGHRNLVDAYKGVLGEKAFMGHTLQQQFMAPTNYQQAGQPASGYAATTTPPPAAVPAQPMARVEPTRARAGGPPMSEYPPGYKPGTPQEAANYALHLLRDMKR